MSIFIENNDHTNNYILLFENNANIQVRTESTETATITPETLRGRSDFLYKYRKLQSLKSLKLDQINCSDLLF